MNINDFVEGMMNKDHEKLASCFGRFCRYIDYCPSMADRENVFLYGANAIEMYYHNKFMFNGFTMHDPHVVDERTVNFYVDYNGIMVQAIAEIGGYVDEDGETKINELIIRPS